VKNRCISPLKKHHTERRLLYAAGLCRVPLRYTVAVLGFVGFFCAFASRGCINVAIVIMVNSTADDDGQQFNTSADRCPPHGGQNVTIKPSPQVCCTLCSIKM